jgi:hypothetical protein
MNARTAALDSQDNTEIKRWYVLFLLTADLPGNPDRCCIDHLNHRGHFPH